MSLSSTNRRKSSDATSLPKNQLMIKPNESKSATLDKSETNKHMDIVRKSDVSTSVSLHRKSNTENPRSLAVQEKASEEVHEFKFEEFAGVTIIVNTVTHSKAMTSVHAHGKAGAQSVRRKSDY